MAVGGCAVSSDDVIVKSPNDRRLYRFIQLTNGLCALLVHDPEIYSDEPSGKADNSGDEDDGEDEDEEEEEEDSEDEEEEDSGDEEEDDEDENGEVKESKGSVQKKVRFFSNGCSNVRIEKCWIH